MRHWARLSDLVPFSRQIPEIPSIAIPTKMAVGGIPETQSKSRESEPPAPLQLVKNKISATAKAAKTPQVGVPRPERVKLEGHVIFSDGSRHKILNISETGVFLRLPEDVPILGTEVRFTLQAKALGKGLDMTGVLIREEMDDEGNAVANEFTKVNPVHRRILRTYVESKLSD